MKKKKERKKKMSRNTNRNKTHELVIDINARSRENIISDTTFFSVDAGTSEKIISFTRNHQSFDLTDATVVIGFHFVDKWASKIIDSVDGSVEIIDPVGGKCRVDIPSHVYDYEGDVMVHVYLKFENGQSLDCGIISTRFERSWLEGELPEMEEVYVKRFEDLARYIRERAEELHRLLSNVDKNIVSQDDFDNHVNDMNNPHQVTVEQIPNLQNELDNRVLLKDFETQMVTNQSPNLDDYTSPGVYYFENHAGARPVNPPPNSNSGWLIVHRGEWEGNYTILQEWHRSTISPRNVHQYFKRIFTTTTGQWSDWLPVAIHDTNIGSARGSFQSGRTLIQTGTISVAGIPGANANSPGMATMSVTFNHSYSSIPNIQVSGTTSIPGTSVLGMSAHSPTTMGFEARVARAGSGATTVRWLAIGTIDV